MNRGLQPRLEALELYLCRAVSLLRKNLVPLGIYLASLGTGGTCYWYQAKEEITHTISSNYSLETLEYNLSIWRPMGWVRIAHGSGTMLHLRYKIWTRDAP